MKIIYAIFSLLFCVEVGLYAQSPEILKFIDNPNRLNPAFCGSYQSNKLINGFSFDKVSDYEKYWDFSSNIEFSLSSINAGIGFLYTRFYYDYAGLKPAVAPKYYLYDNGNKIEGFYESAISNVFRLYYAHCSFQYYGRV